MAGFARLAGSGGRHDVVVALDVSTSTNEHAGVDVNGDGRRDDGWKGPDSIYRAQLAAVRNLVACLEQMPQNAAGERIRIGIVTYSGDERLCRLPEDARRRASDTEILRLATPMPRSRSRATTPRCAGRSIGWSGSRRSA